jgi:hypothetical protein
MRAPTGRVRAELSRRVTSSIDLLVQDHPDKQGEGILSKEPIGVGIAGQGERNLGHTGIFARPAQDQLTRGSGASTSMP